MAGYEGYFMKGLAGGIQSGVNLGLQVQEMKWQKAQRKKLEEKQEQIKLGMANISNIIKQCGADGLYSEDDETKIFTAFWASIPEVQAVWADAVNSIQTMNKKKFEEDMQWLDLTMSQAEGLDWKNAQGIFDYTKRWITTEKGRNYFEAYENISKRRSEAIGVQPITETFTSAEALKEKYPTAGVKYTEQGYVPTFAEPTEAKGPTMADEKSAINLLRSFIRATPEQFENQRRNLEQRTGLDLSVYTQDILREAGTEVYNLYNTPEEVMSNVKAPAGLTVIPKRDTKTGKYYGSFSKETAGGVGGYRATSLNTQEDYKQKALGANTLEDKNKVVDTYAKADYDPSEMPTDQEWIDAKLEELESHVQMLKEITDENGKLIGDKSFKFMSGDEEESKKGSEWYKDIYEAYTFYLEELKKMGIDVSKYPKIKPPGEASKVGFFKGAFTPGVEKGYPSIYYTETTPTPTETEIPKLPNL